MNKIEAGRDYGILAKMIKSCPDLICAINRDSNFIFANDAFNTIIGYKNGELIGCQYFDFVHPKDYPRTQKIARNISKGLQTNIFENSLIHKSGKEVLVQWSAVWHEEEEMLFCVGRDATGRKKERGELLPANGLHQALIEYGTGMVALLDVEAKYRYVSGSFAEAFGYQPEQVTGQSAFNFIHPEDIGKVQEALWALPDIKEPVKVSEVRLKTADGNWRWSELTAHNQLQNPAIKAWVIIIRDITDAITYQLNLQESQLLYKPLFEQNPDMVLLQDKEGVIVDVNQALLTTYNLKKQDIVKSRLSNLLPPAALGTCENNLQKALKGNQVKFEIELMMPGFGRRIYDIKKIPVTVGQEVVGVYSVLKDITEVTTSLLKIKEQTNKLNNIFESITDALFTLDRKWNFTFINREFDRLLHTNRAALLGKSVWEIFPDEVDQIFYQQYQYAVQTGNAVHFESYFKRLKIWLEVKAFPSEEGLSVYFSDVTEKVKSKQELEKLSLVASKTVNGVIITDANGLTEWVNEGFTHMTGYTLPEVAGKCPGAYLKGPETDETTAKRIEADMRQAKPFLKEILLLKKSGEKLWILLEMTPILNEAGELTRFIGIQTDITFRKEAEEIQEKLRKDLNRQNQDLQQFTYIVSHNLRAPVANAIGLAEMLTVTDKHSAIYDQSLANLKTSIGQLEMVLSDLNLILPIRNSKDNIAEEQVEVAAVCRQVVESLQEALLACNGEVQLHMEEGSRINGKKAFLYSIFHNLLSNAIKYRSAERDLKVIIKCENTPEKGTIISFSDNGSGFDTKKAGDKIFSLYKRFHPNMEGRGIGLFLVKTHVEAMGGHIELISRVNEGTKFIIYSK